MAVPARTVFGHRLRHELEARGMSARALSRILDPKQPEVARRNLVRWIGGYNQPSRLNRIAVAQALGLPADALLDDDDEEEDIAVALMGALRLMVREELAKAARA